MENKHQSSENTEPQNRVHGSYIVYEPMNPIHFGSSEGQRVKEVMNPNEPMNPNEYEEKRHTQLDEYRKKQPFRVAIGRSTWVPYETFNPAYNLREILNDEIVIEFDSDDLELVVKAISATGINLYTAGVEFEYWDHGGKSPHLHIHNLPIAHLSADKRALFKKIFIRKYVPLEYLPKVDFSLTGVHLIAIEWAFHWKGKYSYKKLIHAFKKKEWGELQ